MSDIISGVALGSAAPVIKKALNALEPTIRKGATGLAKHLIDKAVANLRIGFSNYLSASYDRCRSVKTLLSQDRPLALLDIYVHLLLKCQDETIEDDNLIENLESYGRIVITGLAGCGKSIFIKYLTLCRFENGYGKIPLFVELRQLNALTSKNLLAFVHESCALAGNRVTFDQFELALRAGGILLILDGFDEIDLTHRDAISGQILDLSTKYPDIPIVLSSRPDNKFASWQNFYTFTVEVFDKRQVLELIAKIDYDEELKKRFYREVDRHLYDSHQSFLSSPLLASIMLLTYEQFAEIPTKMHIFYAEAFEALFRRHDAQKAQFVRKTYANLPIDDFKKFFAAFCAFSYIDEQFSFPEPDLRKLALRSLKYVDLKVKVDDILNDLYECVCMLQRDGIQVMFVHRSFQEYFSALFASEYHGERFVSILDKFSERTQDQVIPMLFEMARDRLDREWILPRLNDVLNEAESLDAETWHRNIGEYMFSGCRCHASLGEEKLNVLTVPLLLRGFKFYYWILPLHGFEKVCMAVFSSLDEAATNFVARELEGISNREQVRQVLTRIGKIEREGSPNLNLWLFTLEITYLLSDPKVALALETLRKTLQQVKAAVDKRLSGQESMVELLFQELIPATNPKTRKNTRASKKNA